MYPLNFVKLHGQGNDFILIDGLKEEVDLPPHLIHHLCRRRFGVGADGVLLLLPSQVADFRMRIYNADGSEAEMCGNGIRCLGKYVYDHGLIDRLALTVETGAGIKSLKLALREGRADRITVNMGMPVFEKSRIPMAGERGEAIQEGIPIDNLTLKITALSMGNPHCVLFVDEIASAPVEKLGPLLENSRFFPQRTNVEFVSVLKRDELEARVWERGVGETLACGTGACAAAVASARSDFADRKVVVHLPGGDLEVDWQEDGYVYLTGPVVEIYQGMVLEEWLLQQYEED